MHYRSSIEYSPEALDDASKAYERIEAFLMRVSDRVGNVEIGVVPDGFRTAMDDDLAVPRALAVVHEQVRSGNAALTAGDSAKAASLAASVRAMVSVLGVDPFVAPWNSTGEDRRLKSATGALIIALLEERARSRAARDFATADAIRDRLAAAGFAIEDTKDGPIWSVAGER